MRLIKFLLKGSVISAVVMMLLFGSLFLNILETLNLMGYTALDLVQNKVPKQSIEKVVEKEVGKSFSTIREGFGY